MRLALKLLILLLTAAPLQAQTRLTMDQVAAHAYAAGFRGGSLVTATAVADAESSRYPLAVCNIVHIQNSLNVLQYYPNGKPVLACHPLYDGTLIAQGMIVTLSDGRKGKVTGWDRGLWQFTDGVYPNDVNYFDPVEAAKAAFKWSRGGKYWNKWVSIRDGRAWESARLAAARTAARSMDPFVLPASAQAFRVEAHRTMGAIRQTAGGTMIRWLRTGDTGVTSGTTNLTAVTAPFTDTGGVTSQRLWRYVQWDSGDNGWVVEDAIRASQLPFQLPGKASAPVPAHQAVRQPLQTALQWKAATNAKQMRLYFGTTPALTAPGDLRQTGSQISWAIPFSLLQYTNYYWRVDAVNGGGTVTTGDTWTFRTVPPDSPDVTITQLTSPTARAGSTITVSARVTSVAGAPYLVGATIIRPAGQNLHNTIDRAITTVGSPTGVTVTNTINLPASLPPGSYQYFTGVWQDVNGDSRIRFGDVRKKCVSGMLHVLPAAPVLVNLTATPASVQPGQAATVSARSNDGGSGAGVGYVHFYRALSLPDGSQGNYELYLTLFPSGNGESSFQYTPQQIGKTWFKTVVVSNNGAQTEDPRTVTVEATWNDHTRPVVAVTSPADGAEVSSFVPFTGTASDNDVLQAVELQADGGAWQTASGTANWQGNLSLAPGTHTVNVRARDRSGNVSTPVSLLLYHAGTGGGFDSFDGMLTFENGLSPEGWNMGIFGGMPDFTFGKMCTSQPGQPAMIWRFGNPPQGTAALEFSAEIDGRGAVTWQNTQGARWTVDVKDNGNAWTVLAGAAGQPGTYTINRPAFSGPVSLYAFVMTNRLHIKLAQPVSPWLQAGTLDIALTGMEPSAVNRVELSVTADFFGETVCMDNAGIRAVPAAALFQVRNFQRMGAQGERLEWPAFAGRVYQADAAAGPQGPWQAVGTPVTATGIVAGSTVPRITASRRFFRLRQLHP